MRSTARVRRWRASWSALSARLRTPPRLPAAAGAGAEGSSRYERDLRHGIAPAEEAPSALSTSVLSAVASVGRWFSRLESGDFRTYIVYIVGALVFFLALIILVR